jgi:hypothetical protein
VTALVQYGGRCPSFPAATTTHRPGSACTALVCALTMAWFVVGKIVAAGMTGRPGWGYSFVGRNPIDVWREIAARTNSASRVALEVQIEVLARSRPYLAAVPPRARCGTISTARRSEPTMARHRLRATGLRPGRRKKQRRAPTPKFDTLERLAASRVPSYAVEGRLSEIDTT